MTTKQTIIAELKNGPQTSYRLGIVTNRPQPSVRRTIGELRSRGWGIDSTGTGLDAMYRLTSRTPLSEFQDRVSSQADGDHGEGEDASTDAFDTNIDAGDSV